MQVCLAAILFQLSFQPPSVSNYSSVYYFTLFSFLSLSLLAAYHCSIFLRTLRNNLNDNYNTNNRKAKKKTKRIQFPCLSVFSLFPFVSLSIFGDFTIDTLRCIDEKKIWKYFQPHYNYGVPSKRIEQKTKQNKWTQL